MGTLTLILNFDNLNTILSLHYCPLTDNVIFVSYYSPYFVIFFFFFSWISYSGGKNRKPERRTDK